MRLPPELVLSIHNILQTTEQDASDPMGSLDGTFDPIATLNSLVPNEEALVQLENIQAKLETDRQAIQSELDELFEQLQQNQDPDRMQIIQELISELLSQLNRIREKASESEAIVREITKDIQVLDLAKKNILASVTTLKRFQMLANAVGQLERQIPSRRYAELSQTLAAVKEVAAVFKQYTAIERIATVWRRVQELQGTLRTMIDEDFDAFFLGEGQEIDRASLSDACLVVDVMGPDVRNHIVERYCAIELREYRRIFRANDEAGQLDNVSRRFAWFRRILANHEEEKASVFPPAWKVAQHLFARFSEITRDDMMGALSKASSSLTVSLLLETFRQTLDFEQSIANKFGMPINELVQLSSIREAKTISSTFDAHMGVFVDAQDKALSDMVSSYRGPKARTSTSHDDGSTDDASALQPVLPSSTELFYFYGQNLEQCAKFSNKGPLFDLSTVHKKWLRIYAEDVLVAGLKRTGSERERRSLEGRVNVAEIRNTCLMLNTAEYCQVTSSELEDKIREKISEEFKEKVTFQRERDLFLSVISSAIVVLLRELEASCDPHFSALTRTLWANIKNVSSQSTYMTELVPGISTVADLAREVVEKKKYLRNFYDKAASLLLTRFTNAIVKSRPIKEAGAQQLLLDLQALKAALLKLPGPQTETGSTSSYVRNVSTGTGHLETLLKILDVPTDPPEEFIQNYTLLVGDHSFSNFQKVLDLKGTARLEQGNLLDNFVTFTSTREHLEPTSFLSAIDMDPPAHTQPLTGAITAPLVETRSLFGGLTSPAPDSGSATPNVGTGERREVFSDLKRLVTFAVRRDREQR